MTEIPFQPELLLREIDRLRGLARELVADPNEADDLAQEAVIAGLRSDGARAPRAWLAGVVRRLAAGGVRQAYRRRRREQAVARDEAQEAVETLVAVLEKHEESFSESLQALEELRSGGDQVSSAFME